ncbi:MAG: SDR family NAD(P)-dependent oxidoreductase, partial [Candidatus Acidiferrales bacterium]
MAQDEERWAGKWVLITGASAGIGRAMAERLAAGGANLVLTARRRERLEELAVKFRSAHSIKAEVFAADLAQPSAPEEIRAFTQSKNLEIELLINNAG